MRVLDISNVLSKSCSHWTYLVHEIFLGWNLMMRFFNRTGLERVGVNGPDLDCCWAGLQASGSSGL